jgi:UDP-N-acetylmuramoyl-tripeptide--D-alanyl-D-alanine ligase
MAAAIKNFAALKADKKILMLGSMAELGRESLEEHQYIVSLIDQYQWEKVILVGSEFAKVKSDYPVFATAADAGKWWKLHKIEGAYVLLKGSRSTGMEKVLDL